MARRGTVGSQGELCVAMEGAEIVRPEVQELDTLLTISISQMRKG